jgi:hypothetical protein
VQTGSLKLSGIKGICRLVRIDNDVAVKISSDVAFVSTLCDIMEAPLKGFRTFRSQVEKEKEVYIFICMYMYLYMYIYIYTYMYIRKYEYIYICK